MSRDLEFIHYLFRTILNREPSPEERATWTHKIAEPSFQALSYDSIAQAFQSSDEAQQLSPQPRRNLILGFCAHYTLDQVLPFLISARTHHPNAAIVLIAHSMPPGFVDWCQANQVRLVAVPLDASAPQGALESPPLIALEVLSPDDSYADLRQRARDLRAMGTPNIWLQGDRLQAEGTEAYLDPAWLWTEFD
jgi:hypothetical protein